MKLDDIDPAELARTTIREALDAIHSQLFGLVPFADYRIVDGDGKPIDTGHVQNLAGSTVGHAVVELARYAQTGAPLDAPVQEYCITLIPVAGGALDDSGTPDPSTPLGLVVAAATARESLAAGHPVTTARLAILGGVTQARVRQLVSAGELDAKLDRTTDRDTLLVRAADAIRWLSGRGVPGFF